MSDVEKQKAFVKNKRNSRTKVVKRSVRSRMGAIENVTVTLVGELRTMLRAIEEKHQEQTIVTTLLARNLVGDLLSDEDRAIIAEYISLYEVKQTPDPEPALTSE
jgi:hypothetical protein